MPKPPDLPLTPNIVPLQLLRIGTLAIAGAPAEFTTMAGRKLRESLEQVLIKSGGVSKVVLCCYANEYASYVCTEKEYDMQYYEGASTLFGRGTLQAYIEGFKELATGMVSGQQVQSSITAPDYSKDVRELKRVTFRNYSDRPYALRFYDPTDLVPMLTMLNSAKVVELPPYGEVAWLAPPSFELFVPLLHQRIAAVPSKLDAVQVSFNDKNLTKVPMGGLVEITRNSRISVSEYSPPGRAIFWKPEDEDIFSGPAGCSWGDGDISVFWRRSDGAIFHRRLDISSGAYRIGTETFASKPAVVSRGTDRIDIFVRGTDDVLYFSSMELGPLGAFWNGYTKVSGLQIKGEPAACVFGQDGLIVFARGQDNKLYANILTNSQWGGWSHIGNDDIRYSPACFSQRADRAHFFVCDSRSRLFHGITDGVGVLEYNSLDGDLSATPAICSSAQGLVDLFACGVDQLLYHRRLTKMVWGEWILLGTNKMANGDLGACSPRADRVELFVRTHRGKLGRRHWDGSAWKP